MNNHETSNTASDAGAQAPALTKQVRPVGVYVAFSDLGTELGRYSFVSPVSAWNQAVAEHGERVGAVLPASKLNAPESPSFASLKRDNELLRGALRKLNSAVSRVTVSGGEYAALAEAQGTALAALLATKKDS